jgi:beta-glucosidase/6-phospho-beta-glucosidase/beta-galactosidase
MDRVKQLEIVQNKCLEMFKKKNQDYGDAFAKFGVIGILMRIEDKIQRSLSITKNGVNLVDDEGIRDTLMDLHNYAAMGVMLLDENENNKEEKGEKTKREVDVSKLHFI